MVEWTCWKNWKTEVLLCLWQGESDVWRGQELDVTPSHACLLAAISGDEISGSSIVELTTIHKIYLIRYSCIAPLRYSTDTAGISISKFTAYAMNNESSVLNRGVTVWSFLIKFPTENPGAHAFPMTWRVLSLLSNCAHTSIYSILANRILYFVWYTTKYFQVMSNDWFLHSEFIRVLSIKLCPVLQFVMDCSLPTRRQSFLIAFCLNNLYFTWKEINFFWVSYY